MTKNPNRPKRQMTEGFKRWMTILVQTPIPNLRRLPVILKKVIWLLIGAHLITEISSILTELFPAWSDREVSYFVCPKFELKMPFNWWLKYLSDDVFNV